MYNQCLLCDNGTLIAFQDESGSVQLADFTFGRWSLTELGQEMHPSSGTGLALQPFYRVGEPDQVNLYYQKTGLNLSLASWKPNGQSYKGQSTSFFDSNILMLQFLSSTLVLK
jgi:hypothetical protein